MRLLIDIWSQLCFGLKCRCARTCAVDSSLTHFFISNNLAGNFYLSSTSAIFVRRGKLCICIIKVPLLYMIWTAFSYFFFSSFFLSEMTLPCRERPVLVLPEFSLQKTLELTACLDLLPREVTFFSFFVSVPDPWNFETDQDPWILIPYTGWQIEIWKILLFCHWLSRWQAKTNFLSVFWDITYNYVSGSGSWRPKTLRLRI